MCGIAGIIHANTNKVNLPALKAMTDIIAHRGPDGDGHWISSNGNVGLGHRRLSIIDLSHEADQPMHYLDRYTIVFNGEIYNYIELKDTLQKQGYTFKTQSDTEVLMALYDSQKEDCLQLLDGMFAFVIYDYVTNEVFVARDRFGEKPFYYNYKQGQYFYFGSEMKCLWQAGIGKEINNTMLYNYLQFGFIENPQNQTETFYNNCIKLPHSHYLKIDINTITLNSFNYYSISTTVNQNIKQADAEEQFRHLFTTSVQRRLRSDVTVGSSLSGGLDSSLVVCVIDELKKGTSQKQKTFSAVFPGFKKDERKYMDYVIAKTNVEPHFVTPDENGLLKDIEKLCWHQEEPFGSASIYVQYCVMQLAKQNNVTVLLDGQGADEILAGYHPYYNTYFNELKKNNKAAYKNQFNAYTQLHASNPINGITTQNLAQRIKNISPAAFSLAKGIKAIAMQKSNQLISNDFYTENKKQKYIDAYYDISSLNSHLQSSSMNFGLQQLLRYADRNSMAHSREVRLPFLNHELVDFVFSLPPTMKINKGWTKWLMRETFKNVLPNEIAWRLDKIGYEPPQQGWMQSKIISEKINDTKVELIKNKILSFSTSNKQLPQEMNWKILMIGHLL